MLPRLRFALNPTLPPHVAALHTALFNWALARALGGDFILRLEDADPERSPPHSSQNWLDALAWLGLDWDEGPDSGGDFAPYVQSARWPRHQQIAAQLLAAGHAYYGDDPDQPADDPTDQPLRLRLPRNGVTILHDALRGPIPYDNAHLKDPVLLRRNGRPLHHLAHPCDDHDMGITHVVRDAGWLTFAPFHVYLYQLMGWPEPVWLHLPPLVNKQGQQLSQRDPAGGYRLADFQNAGYLPAALFNYLLLLGWTPDAGQEILDKWLVRKHLRLEQISADPAIFDWQRLNRVNRHYLDRLSDEKLAAAIRPFLEDAYDTLPHSEQWLVTLTAVIRPHLNKLEEAIDLAEWACDDNFSRSAAAHAALSAPAAHPILLRLIAELAAIVLLDQPTAAAILRQMQNDFPDQIAPPIHAALTGRPDGSSLPAIMSLLGKERCLQRLGQGIRGG